MSHLIPTSLFCTCLVQVVAYFLSDKGYIFLLYNNPVYSQTIHSFLKFTRSTLWGEFAWMGAIIFEGNYMVWRQLPRGQFSLGAIFLGDNCTGGSFSQGKLFGGNYLGGGAIIQGVIIQGASIRGAIFLGGSCPGSPWKSAKGSFAVKSDTHSSWYETNSYICQFSKSTVFYFIYKYKFGTNSQPSRSRAVFMKLVRLFSKQKHFLSCY